VSVTLPAKILWTKMEYVGLVAAPTAWLIYSLHYADREEWVTRRNLALLSIVPLAALALTFTNDHHGLIWRRVRLDTGGAVAQLDKTFGVAFWGMAGYLYLLMIAATALHVRLLASRLYRWRAGVLMLGTFLAYTGATLDTFKISPLPRFVATSLGIALGGLVTVWILYHMRQSIKLVSRRAVFENMSDAAIVLNAQDRVVDLNAAARRLMDATASNVIGQPVDEAWPQWPAPLDAPGREAETRGEVTLDLQGETRVYDVRISPLMSRRRRLISRAVVLRDITKRKRAEEALHASLREKEVLLQEIHHRVKNNLQVISSLLNLQARRAADEQARAVLTESQNRVRSMTLVHEKLYQSPDLSTIHVEDYLGSLTSHLLRVYGGPAKGITVDVEAPDVTLSLDAAITCGLIVNELVTNALRHAFPQSEGGGIRVALRAEDDHRTLTVRDDGIGLPGDVDVAEERTDSLGLDLVAMLVRQLQGTIAVDRQDGTTFEIAFPARRDPEGGGT
jgi:PAS domain S-box-containing protein